VRQLSLDPPTRFRVWGLWGFSWKSVGRFAKRALDNKYVRGALSTVAIGLACGATAGIGCAVGVGIAACAGLGALNWRVNHRRDNGWRHIGGGALEGGTAAIVNAGRGALAARSMMTGGGRHAAAAKPWGYLGQHRPASNIFGRALQPVARIWQRKPR
jgi:hypothetical protein